MVGISRFLLPVALGLAFPCEGWTLQGMSRRRVLAQTTSIVAVSVPAYAKNLPEVSSSVDLRKTGTIETLIPVIRLQENLRKLETAISLNKPIDALIQWIPREEEEFKNVLDAYSDPVSYKQRYADQNAFLIYYSKGFDGPNRETFEDGLPVKQTLQYGARNDAWVAYESFLVELGFQTKHPEDQNVVDLLQPLHQALSAVDSYICEAPPSDVDKANKLLHGTGG